MNRQQAHEFFRQQQQAQQQAQQERVTAARHAAEVQQAIDETPRTEFAVIVAVDLHGGFAKDGKMPWHFPQDLKWFHNRTKKQICVMGRNTYEDINERLTKPGAEDSTEVVAVEQVLPGRKCFVVSKSLTSLPNATVVPSLGDVLGHLEDEDLDKTIFVIGGERLFIESLALANTVYITVINGIYDCDKFFPTSYLLENFRKDKVYKHADSPECRFTVWKRNVEKYTND